MDGTPAWGIKPVPERLRVLGLLDTGLLWGNLGVSLLVLVAGTYLVPALSLREAFLAILVGSLIGNAMLGLAALIGADARVPAMVLMRAPLGQRGSWAPTVLNAAQCIGWSIFELLIIATAVAALSDELLGFRAQWLWTLVFGGDRARAGAAGPDRLRPQVRPQGRGLGGARLAPLPDVVGARRLRLRRPLGPRAARAARRCSKASTSSSRSRSPGSRSPPTTRASAALASRAFWGTGGGYFLASVWLWALGAVLFFSRDITDPAALPVAVAAGGIGAVLALLAVTVDETDEAFANVYSTAVSIQNLAPRVPQRALLVAVAAVATLGALTIDLLSYESFLLMLGSFFVPLFGVLLADWLAAGAPLPRERRLRRAGRALGDARGLDRRLRALPVAPPGRARRGGRTRSATRRTTGSARRCRASSSPSCSRSRSRHWGSGGSRVGRGAGHRGDRESRARHDRRRPAARRRRAVPRRPRAAPARRQLADRRPLRGGRPANARRAAGRARRPVRLAPRAEHDGLRAALHGRGAGDGDHRHGRAVDARGRTRRRAGRLGPGGRADAGGLPGRRARRARPRPPGRARRAGARPPRPDRSRSCSTPTSTPRSCST